MLQESSPECGFQQILIQSEKFLLHELNKEQQLPKLFSWL
jgi:hypothetical protein